MALTYAEEQELKNLQKEVGASKSVAIGLTPAEEQELVMLQAGTSQDRVFNNEREASLGILNRGQISLEPLVSNKKAFLDRKYGAENVEQRGGDLYLKQYGQFLPINKPGFSTGDVAEFAGALPEAIPQIGGRVIGGIGGALLGAPSGPGVLATTVAGQALGGAAGGVIGSGFRQGLSALTGTPQVASAKERLTDLAISGGAGALFGGGAQAIKPFVPGIKNVFSRGVKSTGEAISNVANKIPLVEPAREFIGNIVTASKGAADVAKKVFDLTPSRDADALFKIADKHGIDKSLLPEAIEFGKESSISRASRVIAEGPFGEKRLKDFTEVTGQITNAIDNSISSISPVKLSNNADAGSFLIDSVEKARKGVFENLDDTYSNLVELNPGMRLDDASIKAIDSKLSGLRTFAIGRTKRGIGSQVSEGASLLQAVKNLKKSNGSLKQTVEALRNIGEEAFQHRTDGRIPVDIKRLKKLYFDIQGEIYNSIESQMGPDVSASLKANNATVSKLLKDRKILGVIQKENVSPEKVFASLIESGDTVKLKALVDTIPNEVPALKARLLDSMIKRNNDGHVLFDSTLNNFKNKKNQVILDTLFRPEELTDISELLGLGRKMGIPIMSTSGTGGSASFKGLLDKASGAIFNEATLESAKGSSRKKAVEAAVKITKPTSKRPPLNYSGPLSAPFRGQEEDTPEEKVFRRKNK